MRIDLPSGTVTFLFTDVEGSTRLLRELGAAGYAAALAEHRRVVRGAFVAHGGMEVDTQGDAFFVAFPTAPEALSAATDALAGLAGGPISVRIGVHTGTPLLTEEGYVGEDVHRAARIAACGHGGQVLVSASTAALVESEILHDLGEHRLKDLFAPERIYQLGTEEFPALKSLYRTNLPIPATAFLGRDREVAEVVALLARDEVRLLTLTGPGGTGKTRLALQAAAEASERYPDGVFWVPLATLRDPALVLEEASRAVGARDGLAEHIADKHLLLLFDNFEHLIAAVPDLAALLVSCPRLDLLVTSRERLRVRGEQTWPVPPLDQNDAAELFAARAHAVDPSFTPGSAVTELCSRLDELPLAIELAAARTALFSPEQLLDRLAQRLDLLRGDRDADPRQQTLRATIEWSHDLLTDNEQRLFRRLAVFVGGCTYDTAEHIADADPDTLQSLLDKSLLRKRDDPTGKPRYWMLETIREYATEQLDTSGEDSDLHTRHAQYYLALAEEADPRLRAVALRGPDGSREWLNRLESEHDNLRAALDWLDWAEETQQVLRLAGALVEFWFENEHWAELRTRLPAALSSDERATAARAKALIGAADTLRINGDPAGARQHADEALDLYRMLGDRSGTADALWRIGGTLDNHVDAQPFLEEALSHFRAIGDRDAVMGVTRLLASLYMRSEDYDRAWPLYVENLTQARELDNTLREAQSLGALALISADQGKYEAALSFAAEHLSIARDHSRLDLSMAFARVAYVLARAGRTTSAARILSYSEALTEEIGATEPWAAELNDETRALVCDQLGEPAFAEAYKQGRSLTADDAIAFTSAELA